MIVGRIVTAAEGNPLFVEQMVSMLIDNGTLQRDGEVWVLADPSADFVVRRGSMRCLRRAWTPSKQTNVMSFLLPRSSGSSSPRMPSNTSSINRGGRWCRSTSSHSSPQAVRAA